jgi:pectate lyase
MHQNTNLIGYSDREPTGFLNTTYAFNWWGPGCVQRMPMVRVGKIHMLNNYFSCTTASNCINPRKNSEVLIEGNYFEKGVRRYYSQKDAIAVTWTDTNFAEEKNKMGQPASIGEPVTVPYEYTIVPATDIPAVIKNNAGATIK